MSSVHIFIHTYNHFVMCKNTYMNSYSSCFVFKKKKENMNSSIVHLSILLHLFSHCHSLSFSLLLSPLSFIHSFIHSLFRQSFCYDLVTLPMRYTFTLYVLRYTFGVLFLRRFFRKTNKTLTQIMFFFSLSLSLFPRAPHPSNIKYEISKNQNIQQPKIKTNKTTKIYTKTCVLFCVFFFSSSFSLLLCRFSSCRS